MSSSVRGFFVVSYSIAYLLWGLVALAAAEVIVLPLPAMVLLFIGGLAPSAAALWSANREAGRPGMLALLGTVIRWRVSPAWYAVAFGAPALVVLSAIGLGLLVGSPLPPAPPASAWLNVPVMLALFVVLGAIEELGWRAYALPRMQAQMPPLRASLLLGIAWGVWHAPQWFIPATGQAGFPFPAFLAWVVGLSILFSFIYNGTRGSVLLVLLAHAATNAFQGPWSAALATLPEGARGVDPHLLVMVTQVVLGVAILVLTRARLAFPVWRGTQPDRPAMSRRRMVRSGALAGSAFGLVMALAAAGAFAQAVATYRDRSAFPPPGRLVDVGGHRLHLQVAGAPRGAPTIVLEAGLASFSTNWHWVQADLAASRHVVAYDRAGLGWSDAGSQPRDAARSATELHTALQRAGIAGPYVLAGHSYGGLVARTFADLYPSDVSGLVLVDASHPDQWARIPESMGGQVNAASSRVLSALATVGFLRLVDPITPQVAAGLPEPAYNAMRAQFARPELSATGADTLAVWESRTRPGVHATRALGALPLAVVSVTEQPLYGEVLTALQAELPLLSSRSVHRVVPGATHENLISDRAHAAQVAEIIGSVGR